ncbi:MAG: helix-hairpin-helix domain-containing protein [Candidatus Omnitrophota bacterium]
MSKQERLIIIFLLITAALGVSVSYYKKAHLEPIRVCASEISKNAPGYDVLDSSKKLININTADERQLARIPGIGPKLAQRIVAYRQENSPFYTPSDIMKVAGIGKSKYEQMKLFIKTQDE